MTPPPRIDPDTVPSLNVVESALRQEEESYRFRAASIDTRSGLLLGAAGVLVALAGSKGDIAAVLSQILAAAAGSAAVYALWPRVDKGIAPRALRDHYLDVDPTRTRLVLLSTRLELYTKDEKALIAKAHRLRVSAALLLAAVTAIVIGGIVDVF